MRKIAECRSLFPAMSRTYNSYPLAYLDGPGGTQTPQTVIQAVADYLMNRNSNTHGNFIVSQETDEIIEKARESVAVFLGASSGRTISFGANMTSLNFTLSRALANHLKPGDEIVISELDHEANRGPWLYLQRYGIDVREIPLTQQGILDPESFHKRVTSRTKLIALGAASNALGTVNDMQLAGDLCREAGAYLLLDAVHYAPHFPIDVQVMDCDFLLCSAYKFYGPHVGVLYARPGLLESLEVDKLQSQDDRASYRIETGTLNHEGLNGTIAAIEFLASFGQGESFRQRIVSGVTKMGDYEHQLAKHLYSSLIAIDGITVYGPDFDSGPRAPTVSFTIDGIDSGEVATLLGEKGILVWDGDFAAVKPIEVLGLASQGGLVRVGISMYNTEEEIDRLLDGVSSMV